MHAEVVLDKTRNPSRPMDRASTHHLSHRTKRTRVKLFFSRQPERSRVENRIRPEAVAVHVGKFIGAKVFFLQPGATLQDHDIDTSLGQHPGSRRTRSSCPNNAYPRLVRLALIILHPLLPSSVPVPASAKNGNVLYLPACASAREDGPENPMTCQPTWF